MRSSTLMISAALVLGATAWPALSQAAWGSRMSGETAPVVTTQSLTRVAPLGDNFKFPTKADRVQGMPAYTAFSNSPYATPAAPVPARVPAAPDPVYFNSVMGSRSR